MFGLEDNCDRYQLKEGPMWGFNVYGLHKITKLRGFQSVSISFDPSILVHILKVDKTTSLAHKHDFFDQ